MEIFALLLCFVFGCITGVFITLSYQTYKEIIVKETEMRITLNNLKQRLENEKRKIKLR